MADASPELTETERIQAQIERMDALLAAGKEVVAKVDQFYREHDLVPGLGEQKLLGDEVPERHRVIFSRLLAELQIIDQRIDEFDPTKAKPTAIPASTRAVGNRYRI